MRPAFRARADAILASRSLRLQLRSSVQAPHSRTHGSASSKPLPVFEGYSIDPLDAPLRPLKPIAAAPPPPESPEAPIRTERDELVAKARIVFGSRLAGPGERRDAIRKASQNIAGVLVPPRPDEPDNCCMSGCVNCVWDLFRDELEEWAAKGAEARVKLQEQRVAGRATGMMNQGPGTPADTVTSMDDDGGGSEANWTGGETNPDDLFSDIPVGIREFMKIEKKLKQLRKSEQVAQTA